MYFQLVDAATAVGTASSKGEALLRLADYDKVYFGRAHIYVLDNKVGYAKKKFYWNAHELVETEEFPSRAISEWALELSQSCKESLELVR